MVNRASIMKIVLGSQTGVDRAALDAALESSVDAVGLTTRILFSDELDCDHSSFSSNRY